MTSPRFVKEDRSLRTPAAFLPYQQRWEADKSPVKVYEKSRRIGISWAEAGDDALTAASENGMDVWYIGYNKDMAQEFIEDCADWARNFNLAAASVEEFVFADENKDIQAFRIRFRSGFKVVALSSRPSNLRGKQGKIVIDEAAFHDDLPGLLKAAIAMLMWGGRVVVISTHNGDENPFNELINEIRAGKKPYSLHRTTLDDALGEGLYRRICLRLERAWNDDAETRWRQELINFYGDDADEELFCIPARGSGAYFTRVMIENCMDEAIPVLRWSCKTDFAEWPKHLREAEAQSWCMEHLQPLLDELGPNLPAFFGEDFGRTGDLTVVVPLVELPGLAYQAPFVLELRNVPFEQQKQVLFYLVDRLARFRFGALDARGNGQYLAEVAMQRYGSFRIEQVMLNQPWYRDNMPRYKAAYEDRSILIPKDADILEDHRMVRMEKGVATVPENVRQKGAADGGQRHGDSAIAGALAWYAVQKGWQSGPAEVLSGQPRETTRLLRAYA
jgi:phage FluMu gp28-like protein